MSPPNTGYRRRTVLRAASAVGILAGTAGSSVANDDADTDAPEESDAEEPVDSPLSIDWIVADANIQTGGMLNEERVKLTNTGDTSLDLSGYRIEDEVGERYIFDEEFTLAAGASVYVHTGSGTDDADDLYMGYSREIWNDSGDTVSVYDDDDTLVASYTYNYSLFPW